MSEQSKRLRARGVAGDGDAPQVGSYEHVALRIEPGSQFPGRQRTASGGNSTRVITSTLALSSGVVRIAICVRRAVENARMLLSVAIAA